MLTSLFSAAARPPSPQEGDLYREVTVGGRTFRLVYGYYAEYEREGKFNDPYPIYPDLIARPLFTEDGEPIVTAMQDVCAQYTGPAEGDSCGQCIHFHKCEELFGLCRCPRRQAETERPGDPNG